MFPKPQNHHKSTPRPNFAIIPNSFDIKNMPNPTPPSKPPQAPQIESKNHKTYFKFVKMCAVPEKLAAP